MFGAKSMKVMVLSYRLTAYRPNWYTLNWKMLFGANSMSKAVDTLVASNAYGNKNIGSTGRQVFTSIIQ